MRRPKYNIRKGIDMSWILQQQQICCLLEALLKKSFLEKVIKSEKWWRCHIFRNTYISRWLGSYIYYHLPPPWWIAKRNIKIMGGFGSYMLALACKKKVCVEEREVKGSQFVTQCHVKITPLIYFHLGTSSMLLLLLLFLRPCRRCIFCSSIIWM